MTVRTSESELCPIASEVFAEHWARPEHCEPLGGGRVNDSFLVTVERPVPHSMARRFVLQRINTELFKATGQLIEQSLRVVTHLQTQDCPLVPAWVPAQGGDYAVWTASGLWRLLEFVEGEPLQRAQPPLRVARLEAAAAAFAGTQSALESLAGPRLKPNIPFLYQFDLTLDGFLDVARDAPSPWQDRVDRYRSQWLHLTATDGYIHGDCKPDNILFLPETLEPAAVLDLDTVMWGNRWWDLGDLVRSAVWSDEGFCQRRYQALLKGFLTAPAGASERQRRAELDRDAVLDAPMYVAFLLVLRYLTDHLQGDRHFKVAARGDNLERAEERYSRLTQLIDARPLMARELDALLGS